MFQDKVIIITGASSGIGLATAKEFHRQGAKVVLAARSIEVLNDVVVELKENVIAVKTDVSIEEDCKNLIQQAVNKFGKIDILINNAGISMRALVKDVDLNVIRKLMDVNFWGTVYCSKYALPYLLETKGTIVGVSSIAGFIGLPARSGYSASKYAMHGFLETLRVENLKTGLHVLIVAPGFTASNVRKSSLTADGSQQGETPRNEEKMMTAEEVAIRMIKAIKAKKRTLVLTFIEGKFTVFLKKFFPTIVDRFSYNLMAKEPDSPLRQ